MSLSKIVELTEAETECSLQKQLGENGELLFGGQAAAMQDEHLLSFAVKLNIYSIHLKMFGLLLCLIFSAIKN